MTSDLDDVKQLLNLGVGDIGRLEHIKQAIEKNKTLYTSDKEYLKKLIQNLTMDQNKPNSKNILKKSIVEESHKEIPVTTKSSEIFCHSCGNGLSRNFKFCSKCGNETQSQPTLPKQEITITKSKSIASQFQISLGVIILLIGISIGDYQNTFFGVLLFVIGFVGLKNKSKTIDQLLTIVSLIIFVAAIITMLR